MVDVERMVTTRERKSRIWERQSEDWYVEPEWCSRLLFHAEEFAGGVLDPACGMGRIVAAARQAGLYATGSDIERRADDVMCGLDFLSSDYPFELLMPAAGGPCRNVVTNPPFKLASEFARCACAWAPDKVALIFPTARLNAARWIATLPLYRIWLLTPRPSMGPGECVAGFKPWPEGTRPNQGGKMDFCWLVFKRGHHATPTVDWLHRDSLPQSVAT